VAIRFIESLVAVGAHFTLPSVRNHPLRLKRDLIFAYLFHFLFKLRVNRLESCLKVFSNYFNLFQIPFPTHSCVLTTITER